VPKILRDGSEFEWEEGEEGEDLDSIESKYSGRISPSFRV